MTKIDRNVLLHLMKLSHLDIAHEQEAFYLAALNAVNALIEPLSLLTNVSTDEEQLNTTSINLALRDDVANTSISRDIYEQQSSKVLSHFYIVPQVIE
jgi:aspartyl/glutamyl-tRNA(Asn/Gln) amidotransferase C subunit